MKTVFTNSTIGLRWLLGAFKYCANDAAIITVSTPFLIPYIEVGTWSKRSVCGILAVMYRHAKSRSHAAIVRGNIFRFLKDKE